MTDNKTRIPYGTSSRALHSKSGAEAYDCVVRLGNSGLKVSRIILGTMQYGDPAWQEWVIGDEEEATRHIKAAYVELFKLIFFYFRSK